MSTKTTIIRGVAVGWIAHFIGLAVTFVATPIIIHGLGDARYGIWSIVMALTGYYGLADLGLGKATAKYVAQYDAVGDRDTVRRIIATTIRTYVRMASVLVVVASVFAWFFPLLFKTGDIAPSTVRIVVFLIGMRVALQLLGSTYRALLIGHKRFDVTNTMAIAAQVSTAVIIVLIIRNGGGLAAMAVAIFCTGIVVELLTWQVAVRLLHLPKFSFRDADYETRNMMLGFGLLTVVANSARQLARNSGAIIGGIIAGPAAVAYFSVARTLSDKFLVLGKPIGQAAMPTASQLQAEKRSAKLAELTEQVLCILLALAFAFITIIWAFGYQFVDNWIGEEFANRSYLMFCILSLSLVASLPGSSMLQILQGLGQVRFAAAMSVIEAVAVVSISIPMTYFYGMLGMSLTLLLTTLVFSGLAQGWYLLKITGIPKSEFVKRSVLPAILSCLPVVCVAILLAVNVPSDGVWKVILQMGVVMAVALVSIFFICLSAETRRAAIAAAAGGKLTGFLLRSRGKKSAKLQ